jgi:Spy/CpxP family protein refolding chaperone
MNRRIFLAVLAAAFFWASPAAAFREWQAGYGSGPGSMPDLLNAPGLNLTAEQKEKIGALRRSHLREVQPLQERLRLKSRELRELWLAREPDRERIMPLHKEVQWIRNEMEDRLTAYRLEALQILTPEQQQRVEAYRPSRIPGSMGPPGMMPPRVSGRDLPMPRMR